jgi:hypothetical protein
MKGKGYKDKKWSRNKGRRGSIILSYKAYKDLLSSSALSPWLLSSLLLLRHPHLPC